MATTITEHQLAVELTAALLIAIAIVAVIGTGRGLSAALHTADACCPTEDSTATSQDLNAAS